MLGIGSIDEQHQKLVQMINDFYENLRNKSNKELISELVTKMKDYTNFHFDTEETLFKKYGYAEADDHIKEHRYFIEKVEILEQRISKNEIILSYEITSFLKNWIKDHIMLTDKKYVDLLKEHL